MGFMKRWVELETYALTFSKSTERGDISSDEEDISSELLSRYSSESSAIFSIVSFFLRTVVKSKCF